MLPLPIEGPIAPEDEESTPGDSFSAPTDPEEATGPPDPGATAPNGLNDELNMFGSVPIDDVAAGVVVTAAGEVFCTPCGAAAGVNTAPVAEGVAVAGAFCPNSDGDTSVSRPCMGVFVSLLLLLFPSKLGLPPSSAGLLSGRGMSIRAPPPLSLVEKDRGFAPEPLLDPALALPGDDTLVLAGRAGAFCRYSSIVIRKLSGGFSILGRSMFDIEGTLCNAL